MPASVLTTPVEMTIFRIVLLACTHQRLVILSLIQDYSIVAVQVPLSVQVEYPPYISGIVLDKVETPEQSLVIEHTPLKVRTFITEPALSDDTVRFSVPSGLIVPETVSGKTSPDMLSLEICISIVLGILGSSSLRQNCHKPSSCGQQMLVFHSFVIFSL
jgi:hypothetical protein